MNPAETLESATPDTAGLSGESCRGDPGRRVSVAPMMDCTDRHGRYFLRGFSPRVWLYTEMVSAAAIVHGDAARLLQFAREEQPLVLQLGGSEPRLLAAAARAGAAHGYREINLNCGCPSSRVQAGAFGACLMRQPERVAACVRAMSEAVAVPVSVKMRLGIIEAHEPRAERLQRFDEGDYARLRQFTATCSAAGCRRFIVHARQAVIGGLSPRANREVPPLRIEVVQRLKRDFPELSIELNGGLSTVQQCAAALAWADGVMLGRAAYQRPGLLAELHAQLFEDAWRCPEPVALLERMADYAAREVQRGERLAAITRHMLGLSAGRPGARRYRRRLSRAIAPGSPPDVALLMREAAALLAA